MRGLRASTQRSVALHAARERRRERVTTVPSSLILSIKATLASFSHAFGLILINMMHV
jgi:hypothetical protein